MKNTLIIPIVTDNDSAIEQDKLVKDWMLTKYNFIKQSWIFKNSISNETNSLDSIKIAQSITQILSQKAFNFQSKNKISNILFSVTKNLEEQIKSQTPLHFFLLYNGGYRASYLDNLSELIFEPDQTEMLLLYQIACLNQKIKQVYNKGIEFTVVINNGVAKWVNDISVAQTLNYVYKFREMITHFGAQDCVKLLVQSELENFDENCTFEPNVDEVDFKDEDFMLVERFLGRICTVEEAKYRASLYTKAEQRWATDLLPVIQQKNALLFRQIAHPEMLSFRPFPGGAIRIQNGTFGFQIQNNSLHPKLITHKTLINKKLSFVECYTNCILK